MKAFVRIPRAEKGQSNKDYRPINRMQEGMTHDDIIETQRKQPFCSLFLCFPSCSFSYIYIYIYIYI
eukprot:gene5849-4172_t